jgi:Domain of unknown function (DUF4062)
MAETDIIRTPDQRVRVFVSSTLRELAAERQAVRDAVTRLRLVPVLFEALAAVASQQDNPQRAVRLLAAARSQLEASGSGWLDAYVPRAPHDDAVLAALRARLGDTAYEEARAWGSSIGSRPARQYALE